MPTCTIFLILNLAINVKLLAEAKTDIFKPQYRTKCLTYHSELSRKFSAVYWGYNSKKKLAYLPFAVVTDPPIKIGVSSRSSGVGHSISAPLITLHT